MRGKWEGRLWRSVLRISALSCLSLSPLVGAQSGASGQWTWMGGSSTVPADGLIPGIYGKLGVPSKANIPSSRVDAATWTDARGHLWLFGGFYPSAPKITWLNDMWEFDPYNGKWTWVSGGDTSAPCIDWNGATYCGWSGVYGKLGEPEAENEPGGRDSAMTWTDSDGNLWLFGGDGFDGKHQEGVLNDLWKFNPETTKWVWMGGDDEVPGTGYGQAGVYGTKGKPAPDNNPGALFMASVWTDNDGNSWLFGGWGNDANGGNGLPNNMWEFDQSLEEWAWIAGSRTFSYPWVHTSVFGTKGKPGPDNTPGSRWSSASWTDASGNLWMFGGAGYDAEKNQGYLNELWMYDPSSKEWTYMAGTETMYCPPNADKQNCGRAGEYGTQGVPSTKNIPGGRTSAAFWRANDGSFWLFGGAGFSARSTYGYMNDLWQFMPSTHEWTWVAGGDGTGSGSGIYGTLGEPSPENIPGIRQGAATWTDKDGNFWLFGGNALDANGVIGLPNDLWRYQPPVAAR
jgi:N-acetylneuraminic acid mutarotase